MDTSNRAPFRPPTAAEIEAAYTRGQQAATEEPRVRAAAFDPATDRIRIDLASGTTIAFDVAAVPELRQATHEQLARVQPDEFGFALVWEDLDLHLSVEGLVVGLMGGPSWQRALRAELCRQIARSGSDARTLASRENGKKGGRPRKRPA